MNYHANSISIIYFILFFSTSLKLNADTLILKNGNIYHGKIIENKKSQVKMILQKIYLKKKDIIEITKNTSSNEKILTKVVLRDGMILFGYIQKLKNGDLIIKGNEYFSEKIPIKKENIKSVEKTIKVTIKYLSGQVLEANMVKESKNYILVENINKKNLKQKLSKEKIIKISPNEIKFDEAKSIIQNYEPKWSHTQVALASGFLKTLNKVNIFFPLGIGYHLSLNQGLDTFWSSILGQGYKRNKWLPGFNSELSFFNFSQEQTSLSLFTFLVGPSWLFNIVKKHKGKLTFSTLFGATYEKITTFDSNLQEVNKNIYKPFALKAHLGYEYAFSDIFTFINLQLLYIGGSKIPLISMGVNIGVSYKFNLLKFFRQI